MPWLGDCREKKNGVTLVYGHDFFWVAAAHRDMLWTETQIKLLNAFVSIRFIRATSILVFLALCVYPKEV